MAYQQPSTNVRGRTIKVLHPEFPGTPRTSLTASIAAGAVTLSVLDTQGFTQDLGNQYVVVGNLGEERSEIMRVTAAPTATSLTVTATSYAHPVDVSVTLFQWNRVEIGRRTTAAGATTVIATIALQPDQAVTTYVNTGTEDAFYVVRFNNQQTATFSEYSDAAAPTGYAVNTVWSAKSSALAMTHQEINQLVSDDFLNREIENCERDVWFRRKRWGWSYTFDRVLGDTVEGDYSYALPSDIADTNTNASVLGVHIGERRYLDYVTKEQFTKLFENMRHTTVAVAIAVPDVTIDLTDSSDFDDTGTIRIGSDDISYTGNNRTLNRLTGVTAISVAHSVGEDVWQNYAFGEPLRYTVISGSVFLWYPPNSDFDNKNVYLDYYRTPSVVNSDGDALNIPDVTIYHHYLAYKILLRKNDGAITGAAADHLAAFERKVDVLARRERTGQTTTWRPRIPIISPRIDQDTVRATNTS